MFIAYFIAILWTNHLIIYILGNIALHIFSAKAREEYDLESLWAIGSQYDKEVHKQQDPFADLFGNNSNFFNELPAATTDTNANSTNSAK